MLVPGLVIDGRFELQRTLAEGGMGSVWQARHLKLNESVAIKFMSEALVDVERARWRFEREALAIARLQKKTHHVVRIQDYGLHANIPYIVMELLEGEDLGVRLKREKRIPLSAVARLLEHMAKALRPAHEAEIVHRDLKPANIFLSRTDDEEIAKVLDFGLAKGAALGVAGESTKTGNVVGSPHFMSPEQARGKPLDERSDVFSMAVIAYRALTGELPFYSDQVGDVIVKLCTEPARLPSSVVQGLPPGMDAFFERALHKNRSKRFQTAQQLAEGFAAVVGMTMSFSDSSQAISIFDSVNLPRPALGSDDNARTPVHEPSDGSGPGATQPLESHPGSANAGTLSLASFQTLAPIKGGNHRTRVAVVLGAVALGLVGLAMALSGDQPPAEPAAIPAVAASSQPLPVQQPASEPPVQPSASASQSLDASTPQTASSPSPRPPRAAPAPRPATPRSSAQPKSRAKEVFGI